MVNDLKQEVEKKLVETGSIGSSDLADFQSGGGAPEDAGVELEESDTVKAGPKKDPMMEIGASDSPSDELRDIATDEADTEKFGFGKLDLTKVEVTPAHKERFLDAVIDDSRYTEEFSIFNGKVTGVIRSRRTDESRAILKELNRRWLEAGSMPTSEYSTMMRHALLRCQLQELNGVEYAEMEHPLMATVEYEKDSKDPKVTPPKWFKEADQFFGSKSDGIISAIYDKMMEFEQRYWTMVEHANDQNFWSPEGSTLP